MSRCRVFRSDVDCERGGIPIWAYIRQLCRKRDEITSSWPGRLKRAIGGDVVSTLQKFLKILLGSSQFSGYHSASANCPCSLWTEPPNHGPCDPRSGQRAQLPIGWPLQMVLGIMARSTIECWSTFPVSAPSWSAAGGLGTPWRAVSLFLFLPMVREV